MVVNPGWLIVNAEGGVPPAGCDLAQADAMRPAKPLEYIARCLQYPRVLDPDALPSHTTRLLAKVRPSLPSPAARHSHERRHAGFSAAVSILGIS
eukprot:COSAG01_NODE_1100_length_11694_cov_24.520138_8_plen_95_part_00